MTSEQVLTNLPGIAKERSALLEARARQLCKQTLRNHDASEAFSTLLLALIELVNDEEFQVCGDCARNATAWATELLAKLNQDLSGHQRNTAHVH